MNGFTEKGSSPSTTKKWYFRLTETDIREFTKESNKLKKRLADIQRQTTQETVEQEQQRLNRNIERMKGQIKELVVRFVYLGREQGFGG